MRPESESPPSSETDNRGLKKSRSNIESEGLWLGLGLALLHLVSGTPERRNPSTIVRVLEKSLRRWSGLVKNGGRRPKKGRWDVLAFPRSEETTSLYKRCSSFSGAAEGRDRDCVLLALQLREGKEKSAKVGGGELVDAVLGEGEHKACVCGFSGVTDVGMNDEADAFRRDIRRW